MVARIAKDVEPYVVFKCISWTTLLHYLGECLWDWAGGFVGMLLYISDYANSLVTLANKYFNSLLVKHRIQSQRSRFDSRSWKHPWILFWYSVTVLVEEYRRTCRSCASVKIIASAYSRTKFAAGLESAGVEDGRHE